MPPLSIQMICEYGEANAWASYYGNAPAEFARKTGIEVRRVGPLWVMMIPGLDWPDFNRIVGLGAGEAATEAMLDDAIAVLQNAGCQKYMAQIAPLAQPVGLPDWLVKRGFVRGDHWAKVYRDHAPAPAGPTALRVEPIGVDRAELFAGVIQAVFNMTLDLRLWGMGSLGQPGWRHYLAFAGEQPVGCGVMFISGEVAWLGFGGTLPAHRRQGGQGALLARRIADGLAMGCRWFVSETAEDTPAQPVQSYRNLLRAGFKLAYLRANYKAGTGCTAPYE
jgi:hypothetical protein